MHGGSFPRQARGDPALTRFCLQCSAACRNHNAGNRPTPQTSCALWSESCKRPSRLPISCSTVNCEPYGVRHQGVHNSWGGDEGAKDGEVAGVGAIASGRLQNAGCLAESRVGKQKTKRFQSDLSLSDFGVPVDLRTQRTLGIVEMKRPDIVQAEDAVQLVNGRGVPCRGADVIACAVDAVSYTHLRAHATRHDLVCRLLLEKKKKTKKKAVQQ